MRLLASIVVTLVATAGCAGQIITVGSKGDRDSGGEGDDGGPVEDVVVVDTYLPPPFDAQPPPFDSPIVEDTGPCLVGLEPCIDGSQCCSGICHGTCEDMDSGPPTICGAPTNNPCFDCLATACCPQLAACEGDPECSQSLACFEGCFTSGNGLTCSQKCNQAYPSPLESPLTSCATNACLPACQ